MPSQRFRRSVIAFIALILALGLGAIVVAYKSARDLDAKRDQAIHQLRAAGASIVFSDDDRSIDSVTFTFNKLTFEGLLPILDVGSIKSLDFDASPAVNDEFLRIVAHLSDLESLNLGGTRVTDVGLAELASLKKLRKLYLWRTTVSEEGLQSLVQLKRLEHLNVWDTNTSDFLFDEVLGELPQLRTVYVGNSPEPNSAFRQRTPPWHCTITEQGVASFRSLHPDIEVVYWQEDARETPQIPVQQAVQDDYRVALSSSHQPESIASADWPNFLGLNRDATAAQTELHTEWNAMPPQLVWQRNCGEGLSAPSIKEGKLVFTHRIEDREQVVCLDSQSGKTVWVGESSATYVDPLGYSNGPRSTPTIDEDCVYVVSADGVLRCLAMDDGKQRWRCATSSRFQVPGSMYGVGTSPTIHDDLLLMIVGGTHVVDKQSQPAGIVAFDKRTGDVVYSLGDYQASYASIQIIEDSDEALGVAFVREGLLLFDVRSGVELDMLPWAARVSGCVNAATPLICENEFLISEAYGPGSALVRVTPSKRLKIVWRDPERSRERSMRSHWATPIKVGDFVFGCSGRHSSEGNLRCIRWSTGELMWRDKQSCLSSLCATDDHLINLSEDGVIELVRADHELFQRLASFRPNLAGAAASPEDASLLNYPAWAAPVIAHGRLIVRGKDRIASFKITQ